MAGDKWRSAPKLDEDEDDIDVFFGKESGARAPPVDRNLTPLERKLKFPSLNILEDSSIESFVKYLKANECKKIVVMTGAGISTSAGIPDFRSAGTGLYDNLAKFGLPYPEAVFDISYFRSRPEPFFALAKELFPGLFKPTKCHYFTRLLADKNMLVRNYTQNIDTLERVAGIPESLLVEAHGSFATARCVGGRAPPREHYDSDDDIPQPPTSPACGKAYSQEWVKSKIFSGEIPICENCKGLVKPDITFFGESLPSRFWTLHPSDLRQADALIVIGTSLKVHPFASLISRVSAKTPRLLINREVVGVGGSKGFDFTGEEAEYRRDAVFLGDCDEGCRKLAELLGFGSELEELMSFEHGRISLEGQPKPFPLSPIQTTRTTSLSTPSSPVGVSAIDAMLGDAFKDLYLDEKQKNRNK
ncbi:NAD-dependent protein deacetylase sirtuin-2 [Dinochytrium kinnereticum]|nr:NAD-dependent protein deacetylase sirtuin-2 [Dinochytrium kinnereticum]